ncbi:MAG: OsmC family protein [Cellvibrio sp.]|uniref:OsmC family protein n=1 Tax=Cellvibrio sp. TaxID=1965322 RepID=UPI0031AF26C4
MLRTADAVWTGTLKEGRGHISTQSKVLSNAQYGFNTRFEDGPGTNPEELIGAAHAGCFTMALAARLTEMKLTIEQLQTTAEVTLEQSGKEFTITAVHLDLHAKVPGIDKAEFEKIANEVKKSCPVSKVLNAEISLFTALES